MSDDPESAAAAPPGAGAATALDDALLDLAAPGAIALHCLPAHPGEEITAEVLYGERQRIWDQAENRRHAQKALLELLIGSPADRASLRRCFGYARPSRRRLERRVRAWPHRSPPAGSVDKVAATKPRSRPEAGGAKRRAALSRGCARAARQPDHQAARPRRPDPRADPGDARRGRRARPGDAHRRQRARSPSWSGAGASRPTSCSRDLERLLGRGRALDSSPRREGPPMTRRPARPRRPIARGARSASAPRSRSSATTT